MRDRMFRLCAAMLGAMAIALSSVGGIFGLTCAQHVDVELAASEALRGDHPRWANAYLVARIDGIEHPLHAPLTLNVTPTHVFGGDDPADRIRLAARSDGPPDPSAWRIGGHYFLALTDAPELEGVDALVDPCAPNFQITTAEQLDRLVRAAAAVEVREDVLTLSSTDAPFGFPVGLALAVGVIGGGSWLAFRRRSRTGHGP